MIDENSSVIINLEKEINFCRKSFKKINSFLKDETLGLKILLVAIKNNLKIKNQLLDLNEEETKENLSIYCEIFASYPQLKENVFNKLINNFKTLVGKLQELNDNIEKEINIVNNILLNSEEVKKSLEVLFEHKTFNDENLGKENTLNFIELTKIENEMIKHNNM